MNQQGKGSRIDLAEDEGTPGRSGSLSRSFLPIGTLTPYGVLTGLLLAIFTFLTIFPIGRMLVGTSIVDGRFNPASGFSVLTEPWLLPTLLNTVIVVVASTALAVVFGAVLAWLNERTDANLGVVGFILPIIPLLIPSVALAIGWVFVAAPRVGFLNGLLAYLPDWISFRVNIYTWSGLIWVYAIHGIPYVYLVVSASLRNVDPALEEASRIAGAGMLRTLYRVSLPAVRPALIASAMLCIISGLALYSIPAIIGPTAKIDLLSVRMVYMFSKDYPPRMDEAQVLGLFMLALIVMLWMVQRRVSASGQFVTVGGRSSASSRLPLGRWRGPARALMITYMALASVIPLCALIVVSLQPFWMPRIVLGQLTIQNYVQALTGNPITGGAIRNSLLLSVAGATITMVIAVCAAIYVVHNTNFWSRTADMLMKLPAAIPNLVIAAGFLVTFSGAPFFLSGTLLILLLAYLVMYIPSGSIAANAAVTQVGRDMREASYIAGAAEGRTIRRVVLPLAFPGFVAGWTMVFVHMMGDLSAAALLAGIGTPVIGFAILEIWESGGFGILAAFAATMCAVITLVVACMMLLSRAAGQAGSRGSSG